MGITKRFVFIAGLGIPFAAAAAWRFGFSMLYVVIFNLFLIALYVADYFLSVKTENISIERGEADKLFFQTENDIFFYVEIKKVLYELTMEAEDEIDPLHFKIENKKGMTAFITSGMPIEYKYTVIPSKRGAFRFDNIYLRYNGPLGLCMKHVKKHVPLDLKVYPNLKDLGKYRLLIQKHRQDQLPRGERAIRLRGAGEEFESLRAYVEGDDYRKMNWAATARAQKLITNCYQAEKNQPVFIMLDAGRPLSYGTGGYKKVDFAINAALILSDIVNRQGDRSGLLVFDTDVRTMIMPGKGAAHRNQMMEALYHIENTRSTSDYEKAIRMLCERQKRRSIVFLFTDIEDPDESEALTEYIGYLKRRHFPVIMFMKNESLHKMAEKLPLTLKEKYLQQTAADFLNERKKIFMALNAMQIANAESEAERFALAAVNRYMLLRK
ncbi:MAG: DUF58 domain-containing protein [Defluviitaleaceae bacterium]|nr:DUF58 domain-containing protein [Defluviitaleaceae bacterium]